MRYFKAAFAAVLFVLAMPANAALFTSLFDHPDAALWDGTTAAGNGAAGPYGLRVDAIDPPSGPGPTFSVADGFTIGIFASDMTLRYNDDLSGIAELSGGIARNDDGTLWDLIYTLSGLIAAEDGGFKATAGTGIMACVAGPCTGPYTISNPYILTGQANGEGVVFEFDNDGHRLPGDPGVGWVGRGWLLPGGSTDDFLFTAVPVPAAFWLFGSALGLLGWLKRRA